jgi:type IV secretory pathway TraG/TraD family ATPase VirD4
MGWLGLALLGNGKTAPAGVILLAIPALAVLYKATQPSRKRKKAAVAQHDYEARYKQWLSETPAWRIASAPDALNEARALTSGAFLGITPDLREWVTAEPEHAVLVLGPPRSGKTTSLIIPSILGTASPVVSTSTKTDVMSHTYRSRSRYGRVWLFDPSGTEEVPEGVLELQWSPVWVSRNWDQARAMADAMVNASPTGAGVQDGTHWTESAKALLGPMLHAAALDGQTIGAVRRWVLRENYEEPGEILDAHSAELAEDDLERIAQTEERERRGVIATTANVLGAYGSQAVLDRCASPNFSAERFVRSGDTIYITAPSHLQGMLAPLVVGLLEEIRDATYRLARAVSAGREQRRPPVLLALDEIANIAPMKSLPGIVSEGGGQGLQVMACFQDLSQARARWGQAADGFLTLFGTKLVFPGIGDTQTLEALSTMVGDWDRPYVVTNQTTGYTTSFPVGSGQTTQWSNTYSTQRERLLSPSEIANIPAGHALMVRSTRWGIVEHTPFYQAQPWVAVTAQAPPTAISGRGPDDLTTLATDRVGETRLPRTANADPEEKA